MEKVREEKFPDQMPNEPRNLWGARAVAAAPLALRARGLGAPLGHITSAFLTFPPLSTINYALE